MLDTHDRQALAQSKLFLSDDFVEEDGECEQWSQHEEVVADLRYKVHTLDHAR